jgi:hypothetical protein
LILNIISGILKEYLAEIFDCSMSKLAMGIASAEFSVMP